MWAAGNSTSPGGYDRSLLEHWDGSSWSIVPTIDPSAYQNDLNGVVAIAANDVWIVGVYTTDASATLVIGYAQHWNGSGWTGYTFQVVPGNPFSDILAVTATSSSDVWAVGTYYSAGFLPLVEHWNGSSWSSVPIGYPNGSDNELFAVSAWSPTDVWATGEETPAGVPQSFAEHWNGTTWTTITTPNTATGDNEILGVNALEAGHAVGVGFGNFINNGTTPRQSETWDLVASGTSTNNASIGVTGSGDNALLGVARSGGAVWAVGYSRNTQTAPRQTLAVPATWNSASHSLTVGTPAGGENPGAANDTFFGTTAISPYAFWAVGIQAATTVFQTLAETYCALHFVVTAPASTRAGSAFSVVVAVKDGAGTTNAGYRGTVHFTSSDGGATLPPDYTFTPGDIGFHSFGGVVLNTPGSQTVTVNDMAMPFTSPGSSTIQVQCAGACQGPGGTAGSRSANAGPGGTPSARTPANQSSPSTSGPRLPNFGRVAGSIDAAGLALADMRSGAPVPDTAQAAASAPAAFAQPLAAAPAPPEIAARPPSESAAQPPRRDDVMLAPSRTAAARIDNPSYLPVVAIALAVVALALLAVRRRRNRRLIGHTRP